MLTAGADAARAARARDALIEHHAARAYRFAHSLTGCPVEAEAVLRDVLWHALDGAAAVDGPADVGGRLYRLVLDAALARRPPDPDADARLEATLPRFAADGHRVGAPGALEADWSALDPGPGTLAAAVPVVQQGLAALPSRPRAVVALRDVEGLSVEAVADIVGEPVASVRSALHRGRMALREALSGVLAPPAA